MHPCAGLHDLQYTQKERERKRKSVITEHVWNYHHPFLWGKKLQWVTEGIASTHPYCKDQRSNQDVGAKFIFCSYLHAHAQDWALTHNVWYNMQCWSDLGSILILHATSHQVFPVWVYIYIGLLHAILFNLLFLLCVFLCCCCCCCLDLAVPSFVWKSGCSILEHLSDNNSFIKKKMYY